MVVYPNRNDMGCCTSDTPNSPQMEGWCHSVSAGKIRISQHLSLQHDVDPGTNATDLVDSSIASDSEDRNEVSSTMMHMLHGW